ncbi:MAG: hypothetical protein AUJ56_11505 [Zetaproteobacteria bacterium CG1_02_49_23]|nr:MAG: hypothetical protein AUJ56_11505 [Zetaproteobacteria bacterium CG1_02_49_23]
MAGEKRIRREPAQREELLKIPLNKPAPLKREKCRKTMSRIVFAVWQYASLPKGLNSYDVADIGYMSHYRWQLIAKEYQEQGLIDASIPIDQLVDNFVYSPEKNWWDFLKENPKFLIVLLLILIVVGVVNNKLLRKMVEAQQLELDDKQADAEKLHQRYLSLLDVLPDAVLVHRFDGTIVFANENAVEVLCYPSVSYLLDQHVTSFIHPDDHMECVQRMQDLIAGHHVQFPVEMRLLDVNRCIIITEVHASLASWDGEPVIQSCLRDVTQRKQAEEALKSSEDRFRKLINFTPFIMAVRRAGRWIYANKSAREMFGVLRDEDMIGKQVLDFIHPDERRVVANRLQNEQINAVSSDIEVKFQALDGRIIYANVTTIGIEYEGGPATLVIGRDISEEKTLREQVQQAQKMEAMGTMVGGIAHDFNNMLAGISGTAFLAKDLAGVTPEIQESFETIERLTEHGAGIVAQLMAFARKGRTQAKDVDFSDCMKKAHVLLKSTVPENITLTFDAEAGSMPVRCDETQMHQVLFNLVNNAKFAVNRIRRPNISIYLSIVAGREIHRKSDEVDVHAQYVALQVKDNGTGMNEEQLTHMFDPFYTTKGIGEGTGLGLSMVFGVVRTHDGIIHVESEVGKGTSFYIYLPLQRAPDVTEDVIEKKHLHMGNGETILLVEDDELIRATNQALVERLGYKVLTAVDGIDAIGMFEKHQHEIDLVLSDLVMPRLGALKRPGGYVKCGRMFLSCLCRVMTGMPL